MTTTRGLAIGVTTADCGPVLFADTGAGVIGAAHAGWRGALTGIIEATVDAMEALGASREHISAAIGPMIRQRNYEVGPDLIGRFTAADRSNSRFFIPAARAGHALFDLPGYIAARLKAPAFAACRISGCAPTPTPAGFSASAAPPITARPTTAGM